MSKQLTVVNERVDDILLLLKFMDQMGIPVQLDAHFPTHGNWGGLSLGRTATVWLSYILSEGDHRLHPVQFWADQRLQTLSHGVGQAVRALDFSDDRLGDILSALSKDEVWAEFEAALNGQLIRVYELPDQQVRLDSTTASGYVTVTPDGLFQFGHSKDRRPDLPQVKVMISALDPLGIPLVTTVLPGNRADDPLYIPAISQVRQSLKRTGVLYVGDSKMGSLQARAFTEAGGDYYLCPLSAVQLRQEVMDMYLAQLEQGTPELVPVYQSSESEENEESREVIAHAFEQQQVLSAELDGQVIQWTERHLVVRSLKQAQTQEKSLRARLDKALEAIANLNKRGRGRKRYTDLEELQQVVQQRIARYQVQGLIRVHYEQSVEESAGQPRRLLVKARIDEQAVQQAVNRMGWRVYATNAPEQRLPLPKAVLAYRSQYLIEQGMGRLKGRPLSLTPMHLKRPDRVKGLIRLLSIGLRVLTLLEFQVRRNLNGAKLAGLYRGNPKRATARPTAERLLEAFQYITLTIIHPYQTRHLTPLSELQQRILELLNLPTDIYTALCTNLTTPP